MPLILLLAFVAIMFLIAILTKNDEHTWKYRNPYDRTCEVCGRNEQEESWGDDFKLHGMNARGIWEV